MPDIYKTVLLINPPLDTRYDLSVQPPLGLLYIASYLRKNSLDVKILDLNVINKNRLSCVNSALRMYDPDIVGLTSNFSNRFAAREIASVIKGINKNIITVIGGPHPTIDPNAYWGCGIDYIIPFEAERKMLEFVISEGNNNLSGVWHCNGSGIAKHVLQNERDLLEDLDILPFPSYDLVDINKYYVNSFKKRPIVSMITSRGCPCQCIFCSQGVFGRLWRSRSAENIVDEMLWLKNSIGAREISIEDDNFTLDLQRVYKICHLIKSKEINISWQLANGIRADRVTKDLLRTMKEAGCWKIAVAPEVGDKESMEKIGKGIDLDQFLKVAQWCRELDIVYYGFFLMGFPFQKEKEMKRIIEFALKLDPLLMDLSKIVPFPGTVLFNEMTEKGEVFSNNISTYYDRSNNVLLEKWYKKAYMRFYARPIKIAKIIKTIGLQQFLRLARYGIRMLFKKIE